MRISIEWLKICMKSLGIIRLVLLQTFSKNCHLLPPDTHACVRIRGLEMLVFGKILPTY